MQQTNKENTVKKFSKIKQIPVIQEYLKESEFLKKARSAAESIKIPIINDETGLFLELVGYLLKPSTILEIGCGTGYSTYFLLKYFLSEFASGKSAKGMDKSIKSLKYMNEADESAGGACRVKKSYGSDNKSCDSKEAGLFCGISGDKLNNLAGDGGTALKSAGGVVDLCSSARGKTYKSVEEEADNLKKKFSYTGIDLNRERLDQACLFVSGLINKTIIPCHNGNRMKTFIEYETFCCSFEFIHGNAVKIILEEQETEEKYDLVFIDAAKYQYPDYLGAVRDKLNIGCAVIADNIFYCGKIYNEVISKHDENSVAGLTRYLEILTEDDAFKTSLFNIGDGIAFSIYKKGK